MRAHELAVGATASLELSMDYLALTLVDSTGVRFAEAGDWVLSLDDNVSVTVRVM